MLLDTLSGRYRSIPRSAGPTSTPPGPAKGGCRHRPDESGRAGGRARRPRTRPLARWPDDQDSSGSRRLLSRPGHCGHRWTAGRRPGVHRGHGPHPRSADRWRTSAYPPSSCSCRPRVLLSKDPRVPASTADPAHRSGEARPGRTSPSSGVDRWPPAGLRPRAIQGQAQGRVPDIGLLSRPEASLHATRSSPSATRPPSNSP